MIIRAKFGDDQNIGLYGFATDAYCITGMRNKALKNLDVPLLEITMLGTRFCGIFSAGNSHGIAVSHTLDEHEIEDIRRFFKNILVLESRFNAIGNLVLMNDKGIILSPLLKGHAAKLQDFFGIPCCISRIAGTNVVGSAGIATNNGCLLHPNAESEIGLVEKTLGVPALAGTVSYGSMFPKSGIIANSKAILVADKSSGYELGRIEEALKQ